MSSEGKRLKNSQSLDLVQGWDTTTKRNEHWHNLTAIFIFCWHQVCAKCHVSCYSLL